MEKRELSVRALSSIQSITDATRTKTLRFEKHEVIENSSCKLVVKASSDISAFETLL